MGCCDLSTEHPPLSVPIFREMKPSDAEALASLAFESENPKFLSAFRQKIEEGKELLQDLFSRSAEGIYVLYEGTELIGAFKMRFAEDKTSSSLGFRELIRKLGFFKGIRAGILLSQWDEYSPKSHEANLEFLFIKPDWKSKETYDLLLDKAKSLSKQNKKRFLSIFIERFQYLELGMLERWGFYDYKTTSSLLAKILKAPYKWRKLVAPVGEEPITVKEMVLQKVNSVRQIWVDRKEEFFFATKLATGLTAVPIVAGTFAYVRGFHWAAYGWLLVVLAHLVGVAFIFREIEFGRIALAVAVILESGNMILRSINAIEWLDRTLLITLASINLYVAYVMLFTETLRKESLPKRENLPLEKPSPIEQMMK